MLHTDFETRSAVDLLKQGVYNYAQDPSTDVTMMAFAMDDNDVEIWVPDINNTQPLYQEPVRQALMDKGYTVHCLFPDSVKQYIADGGDIGAHNAAFERLMFWYVLCAMHDVPEPAIHQFYCTATQARVNNMPAALGNCARALGLEQVKDKRGSQLINNLSIPNDEGIFNMDTGMYIEFAEYCIQDVVVERAISNAMRPLTESEREDYEVSEIINDRGLRIDRALAQAATRYADEEQAELVDEIRRITCGDVTKVRGRTITDWVYNRLTEPQQSHMHRYKAGERKITMDRNSRQRMLNDSSIAGDVRNVIAYSDFAQASSTAKFSAMLERSDIEDDRVRGAYVCFGASSTLRYSSRGLQMHNLPRDMPKDGNHVHALMLDNASPFDIEQDEQASIMHVLKSMLRYAIKAKDGHVFVCGDWGQIEGRALPWLAMGVSTANDLRAQHKLDLYMHQSDDHDVYCQAAEDIYSTPVRRDGGKLAEQQRQVGKVAELSLGFGGGAGAFTSMAVNYGVYVDVDEAEKIKNAWRNANAWAPVFWKALHSAAIAAVKLPGLETHAGRVRYMYQEGINKGTLWCLLPSGGLLAYPDAQVKYEEGRFGTQAVLSAMKANWTPKAGEKTWPRVTLWPGLLAENVTQAVCAALLRECLASLVYDYNANVIGHTHDEVLLEVPNNDKEYWHERLQVAMLDSPDWAEGLPLAVDIWKGERYRK